VLLLPVLRIRVLQRLHRTPQLRQGQCLLSVQPLGARHFQLRQRKGRGEAPAW
jgi:hypothetical protein